MFQLAVALLAVSVTYVAGAHHHNYHTASPGDVQGELDHINAHFGSHLCIDLLMLDCRTHHANPDEQICGSDGKTYVNHCYFVHASCMFEQLTVGNHGPCVASTAMPSAGSTSMPAAGSTMMPPAGSTMMPAVSTTIMTTQSTMQMTTVKSSSQVIQSVFCQNKDSIKCDLAISFVCGSDGHLYPNSCELSKAACDSPSLITVDASMCP